MMSLSRTRAGQVELELALARPPAAERRHALDADAQIRNRPRGPCGRRHDVELGVVALREIGQTEIDRAARHVALAGADLAGDVTDGGEGIGHPAQLAELRLQVLEERVGAIEGIAAGGLDDRLELTLVVVGDERRAADFMSGTVLATVSRATRTITQRWRSDQRNVAP